MSKKTNNTSRASASTSEQPKYTIAQAFDYYYGPTGMDEHEQFNDERGIRAAAYLLSYCSQHGNEMVDGNAVNGLARILEFCASRVGFTPRPPESPIPQRSESGKA
jgi:hypothetical protein